jgi:DNA ligase-1
MKITKPLLAGTYDSKKAKFPYLGTPKIDGIRFMIVDGVAVSRSFKPIRNTYIQQQLSENLPNGVDGELTSGDTFQSSTSAIMRITGEPQFKVWIFDYVNPDTEMKGYTERMKELREFEPLNLPCYEILYPVLISSQEQVDKLMVQYLNDGYEGLMLRDPDGKYKFGRATVKEGILLKVKDFMDSEAEVIGFKEKMVNTNEATKDAFGHSERSTAQDGLVPADTLGGFILKMADGREFSCGSGLNDALRKEIWNNRKDYLGKLVKYKFMTTGIKDLPRHPVFVGFRSEDDMS